ncbi:integrator complex subunit 4 [Selaginella moellendorffii]|uniref:integrator complex subunit 4 n=1 Tax=Selaginella moellendorffii TaxID=88036 RepID=UPI000D1C5CDB|nr:integrator complex subunit 4 [Selaginella moellendorffii]|eukprot:XP_024532266.1 integrator complex subunit 4 [Selaginella moellendorffii]
MKKRRWLERDGDGATGQSTEDCMALVADPEVRMRSIAISGMIAGARGAQLGPVREAMQRRLWEEQEISVIQQIISALSSIFADETTTSCLQRYYLLDGCPEPIKIRILASLVRICKTSNEHSEVVAALQPALLQDLYGKNPVLRMWGLKFATKFFEQQRNKSWIIAALHKRFFDTHAFVRKAALDAVISLDAVGFSFLDGLNAIALRLLEDHVSESVRLSAMELLRLWVMEVQAGEITASQQRETNYTYLEICTMLTDPCTRVRKEACRVLGTMTSVSQKIKLHSVNKKSVLVTSGDPLISCNINGKSPRTAIVAGAFVSAVEDEFPEVRSAAVQALSSLSLGSKEVANAGVLGLFLDMLNDQDPAVRRASIQALYDLADCGVFCVEDKHLRVITATLEDQNNELRHAGLKLLSSLKLPTLVMFESAVQTLMKCLDRHPQDRKNVYEALLCLGKGHGSHVEALKSELLTQVKFVVNGEKGLDDPRLKAILNLCLPALRSTGWISSLLPSEMLSCKRITDFTKEHTPVESGDSSSTVLIMVQQAIKCALRAGSVSNDNQRETIRGCKKSLLVLERTSLVNLGLLYMDCLQLVAQKNSAKEPDHQKLGSVLGRMQTCFSGFSASGALQLLELNAFYIVIQVEDDAELVQRFSQLASIVEESKSLSSTSVASFSLLQAVEESLRNQTDPENVSTLKAAAASFWPKHDIVSASVEEMRADLAVNSSSFEHRLKVLTATYPFHFTASGAVHHITAGSRIWVQMELEGFPSQYRCLELERKSKEDKLVEFSEELGFYNVPSVSKAALRVSVVVELAKGKLPALRGPQACLAPISPERVIYLEGR